MSWPDERHPLAAYSVPVIEKLPIRDLFIRPLETTREHGVTRWLALKESDHILRRFGEAEILRLDEGTSTGLVLRPVVDEAWAVLEGAVEVVWHDQRPSSPTNGVRYRLILRQPTLLLAPFGVAFGARALEGSALLVRLATHGRDDPESSGDKALGWDPRP